MIRKVLIVLFLATALLTWFFLLPEMSAEDQVKIFINSGVEAAENRSVDDLRDLIHDDYIDLRGNNKKQLSQLLRLYFFQHKNIYLFTKLGEVEFLSASRVRISMHVAMAGSVISDVNALSSLRAQIYEFELKLIKEDDWLLQEAKWRPANIGDLR